MLIFVSGKKVRTRRRDSSIMRRSQPRCGVPTFMHGQLVIDLRSIPYSGLSTGSHGGSSHASSHSCTSCSSISSSFTPFANPSLLIPQPLSYAAIGHPSLHHTYDSLVQPSFDLFIHQSLTIPLHQSWNAPMQPTPSSFVHHTPFGFLKPTLVPSIHAISNSTVHSPLFHLVYPTVGLLQQPHVVHDLHPDEVHRDLSGRVIIRPLGKG